MTNQPSTATSQPSTELIANLVMQFLNVDTLINVSHFIPLKGMDGPEKIDQLIPRAVSLAYELFAEIEAQRIRLANPADRQYWLRSGSANPL